MQDDFLTCFKRHTFLTYFGATPVFLLSQPCRMIDFRMILSSSLYYLGDEVDLNFLSATPKFPSATPKFS